ncbi:MAG: pyruvate:ferredoxin (flavodoxin) oxidoreductase, partial [Clostridia bacterium]|nr:pyruvate:ferredoxin (flavodoxin) oxidoreductase [Clostridia bacterium]
QDYTDLPDIVEKYFVQMNSITGRDYRLFNYYGDPEATDIIVAMGSINDVTEEVIDYLNANGQKVGLLKVRLYRPFAVDKFVEALPKTVKKIAVLDRTKEPGSIGEPLFLDVVAALQSKGMTDIKVIGGRYGLGSKDTPPSSVFAVYDELAKADPKPHFTIGINDDITYLSLEEKPAPITAAEGTIECKFWGLGGDGTVGANKNSIKIIGDYTDKNVQAYFQYDSKKTGGITISHLRFGDNKIKSSYYVNKADFVACHNPSYIEKAYRIVDDVKPGGVFLINCQWDEAELAEKLDAKTKQYIAKNNVQLYTVNAIDLAIKVGMGKRTNTILQAAFFALANIMPIEEAVEHMKDAATKSYSKKGPEVVKCNHDAIDAGVTAYKKVEVPAEWANATDDTKAAALEGPDALVKQVKEIMEPVGHMDGYKIPASAFASHADGQFEQGASAYEKRGVAVMVPEWNNETCVKCNKCAYVCPHATIRPFALDADEKAKAPAVTKFAEKPVNGTDYTFTLAISPRDCMGCGVCVGVCPTESLKMVSRESQDEQQAAFDYCVAHVTEKPETTNKLSVISSQFRKPLLEFSGSCAGCAETAYARLVTQLFGDRMYISNATGCSSIWGGPAGTSPYTVNAEGRGPAWANSLFEDNAEHGYGMFLGQNAIREFLAEKTREVIENCDEEGVKPAAQAWLDTMYDGEANKEATKNYIAALESCNGPLAKEILAKKQYLQKKSIWIFGGDGWAYDIGFGGLDHVLASGEDVNVFVFDTEVYSNTGGQASKASQIGQVAQFAAAGKAIAKKSLAEIAMSYGYVYVAQVAMGADQNQTLKAIAEAEAYHGPSLIIGYSPCEMHSIKGGMVNCQAEMKKAVDCGYWNMFRYNPALKAEGKNPFTLDSKVPETEGYRAFLMNEARYSALTRSFPERAETLFTEAEENAKARYAHLQKLIKLYGEEE